MKKKRVNGNGRGKFVALCILGFFASALSGTIDTIKSLEPNATVNKAIDVSGNSVLDSEQEVRDWVAKN